LRHLLYNSTMNILGLILQLFAFNHFPTDKERIEHNLEELNSIRKVRYLLQLQKMIKTLDNPNIPKETKMNYLQGSNCPDLQEMIIENARIFNKVQRTKLWFGFDK